MKTNLSNLFAILILLFFISCDSMVQEHGNGNITSKEYKFDSFDKVDISGAFEVHLRKASTTGVTVTTDENLHEFIMSELDGDVLKIWSERNLDSDEPILLEVNYDKLQGVSVGGASSLEGQDQITGDYLRVEMSGAGSIDLDVSLKALRVSISGAGAMDIRGEVIEQYIDMSGAGSLEAFELKSQTCEIELSGVGGASVFVEKRLEATVSGVGGVSYKGDPENVISNVSGIGSIGKADD